MRRRWRWMPFTINCILGSSTSSISSPIQKLPPLKSKSLGLIEGLILSISTTKFHIEHTMNNFSAWFLKTRVFGVRQMRFLVIFGLRISQHIVYTYLGTSRSTTRSSTRTSTATTNRSSQSTRKPNSLLGSLKTSSPYSQTGRGWTKARSSLESI